ncbi:MAG: pyridoxal phosphate-dependent aminotransferase [Alphaproteobacteria bacterium]|nr:pyridoxal phosphate-dependent aminotransferase [Alphaproteobacteria bacterium]
MKIAKRGGIDPFIAMEVMKAANERQAAGGDVIHMEVGQPSTGAPRTVREAAMRALGSDRLGYTEALGIPPLRAAIAKHYRDYYGLAVAPERIVVTTGSSGAFLLAFLAVFDHGDRIGVAEPGYPAYRNILTALGIEMIPLPSRAESGFRLDASQLRRAGAMDGILVATPANPTGTMLDLARLQGLVDVAEERNIALIVDEIYHGITYGGRAQSVLALTDKAIVINSFSKYFSMTGWRLGWMVLPEALIRPVECLAQNLFISPPSLSQWAAIAAFDAHDELEANVARYAANRALLLEELPGAGFDRLAPVDGAFYIYADVSRLTNDSVAFSRRMLKEIGVAATPGLDFDRAEGRHFMRFSFAGSTQEMREAARRLRDWRK